MVADTHISAEPRTAEPKYPEHEKLKEIQDQSQACGEFLEWLRSKGIFLAIWVKNSNGWEERQSVHTPTQDLLAEFFGIDRDKLEDEKVQMLNELRKMNADA